MTLQWVLGWWNLIFVVPFGIALTYLAAYVSTGVTFGDADAHVDVDADADLDADADAGADHDVEGHDVEQDVDADQDADGHDTDDQEHHVHATLLSLLGVGRVPLSLLLMIALFAWGIGGFAATQWLHQSIAEGPRVAAIAVPFTLVLALVITGLAARAFARLMPMSEPASASRRDLVGRPGVAVLPIGDAFGLARVSPADGAAGVQVPCRVADGQPPIAAHAPIVVLRFDSLDHLFYVTTPDRLAAFRADFRRAAGGPAQTLAPTPH